jgi:hypothetical protein
MKHTLGVILVLVALTGPVYAAQASDNPPGGQTEKIKVGKAIDLLTAINAITGLHDVVVGQGASARVAQIPYDLNSDVIWALTDDINILRRLVETAQADQKHLVGQAEAKNGGPLKPKTDAVYDGTTLIKPEVASDAQVALNKEIQSLMDSERDIHKLFHIKRSDLAKALSGDSHFPGPYLASLEMIVDP